MYRRQGQPDPAHAEPELAGHFQQPRADRPVLSPGQRRVGEQVELLLLYSVLHVAAGAVQILVELPGADFPHGQAGDHEARDVHERLREEGRISVCGLNVGGQPPKA